MHTLDGHEWEATSLSYRQSALVITTPDGRRCSLALVQIDWETTARRNGTAIDLLDLQEAEAGPPGCATGLGPPSTGGFNQGRPPLRPTVRPALLPARPDGWVPPRDTERYRAVAVRVSTRPILDGALDDAVWQEAIPFGGFFQQERHEGEPATERTEVRILYDADNMYFGIRAYDSEPDRIVAKNMLREGQLLSDDGISILLDPLHDHRTAYIFGTNPNGMRVDSYLLGNSRSDINRDWDGVWDAAARRDAEGWTAEVEIPFTTLRFHPGEVQTWGLALRRNIARRNEPSYWPFIPNDSPFYRASQAGHLDGLRGVTPGASLRLKPYVAAGTSADFTRGARERVRDTGLDVRYWPTPTLTTEFTVNTDFAQTEVDDVQINLTRFPLYYPEKRQFFLEGGRIFEFGTPREAEIFFSRRIGLSADRRPIRVVAGARLNGKSGPYYVGALAIRTAADASTPVTDSFVARAARDVFSRSRIGGILTEQRRPGGDYNRVVGADAAFYRGDALSVTGFAAKLFDPDLSEGTWAGRGAVGWNTDRWGVNLSSLTLGDNFRPDLGFVARPGMICHIGNFRFSPRPKAAWIRRLYFESDMAYMTTQQSVLWTRRRGGSFRLEFESGDNVAVSHGDNYERLFTPFAIRPDQPIPPGGYSFGGHAIDIATFNGRDVQGAFSWGSQSFYDGRRTDLAARAVLRFNKHLSLAPGLTRSTIDLPRGAFTTTIVSTSVTYSFTPDLSVNTLVQWDSDSGTALANVRLNYIPKPGADFYLVYTEADRVAGRVVPRNRSLIVKLNYILDF